MIIIRIRFNFGLPMPHYSPHPLAKPLRRPLLGSIQLGYWLFRVGLAVLVALIALPILSVFTGLLHWDEVSLGILRQMMQTVLPEYFGTSVQLFIMVGFGVALIGISTATAMSLYDFAGREFLQWALLLPLAMPAYVVAYAYTDFLQFSGPLQTWQREAFNLSGRVFPEIRNVWGAAWVFTFTLYPYVYLLVKSALSERASHLMDAARLLGASPWRRLREIALPLARPAIAAGVALALMETLADYGVTSYFGIQSFTTGIYKAWQVMDDRLAATQLASILLILVTLLLVLERKAQNKMRFSTQKSSTHSPTRTRVSPIASFSLFILCLAPIVFGFILPVAFMLRPLWGAQDALPWADFGIWAWNSFRLSALASAIACVIALTLSFMQRTQRSKLLDMAHRIISLGYAVPGAVIVVGLLLPVAWLQQQQPNWSIAYWVTATSLGLIWAYLVRFSSVALQSIQSGYSRIPTSFDESALTLGTHGLQLFATIHWPLLRKATLSAVLLVFVDVMKELPATLVLRPFNSDTLSVITYQLARDERLGEAALPALTLVLVGLIPVLMLHKAMQTK